jgi:alanyl-tRNA synthetase
MLTSEDIRQRFLDFWSSDPRNSKIIPNMSLVPPASGSGANTLLFVNSGMFPISPYLLGAEHPLGTRLHNVQRCIRTKDIEDVGDNRHLVMFEMIGNWSLGDFTKEDQIRWCLELYVKHFGLDPNRLYITVWGGDDVVGRDTEAIDLWKKEFAKYGVEAQFSDDITQIPSNLQEGENWKYRIFPYGREANWWEVAHAQGEPGGPSSEIFYDLGEKERDQEKYHINDDSGRFIEIGNNVFMEYKLDENLIYQPLEKKNIDFGGGFDRIMFAVQNKFDAYSTDLFEPIIKEIEKLSGKTYTSGIEMDEGTKAFRVVAEHARSSVFLLADGVIPSNKDQGYILRRLIRRMVRYGMKLAINDNFTKTIAESVIEKMSDPYPHLIESKEVILIEIEKEEMKFRKTLVQGLKEFEKAYRQVNKRGGQVSADFYGLDGDDLFQLYETYGFPLEMSLEELMDINQKENKKIPQYAVDEIVRQFEQRKEQHQEKSRAGAEEKFKGGLADHSEETTRLHTAHHLLLAALQKVVDPSIRQRGSNITAERLRIDFNLDRKVTPEELAEVEKLVNEKITESLPVERKEMSKAEAETLGAQMEFGQKYGDVVNVYFVGNEPDFFSIEFCGGPHVSNTSELGENGRRFKILKEEASSAGVRRIKATLA